MFVFVSAKSANFIIFLVLTVDDELILNELSLNYFNLTIFLEEKNSAGVFSTGAMGALAPVILEQSITVTAL